jgi:hypothetical protein
LEWGNNINLAELFGNDVLREDGRCIEHLVFGMERYQEVEHIVREKSVGEICNHIGGILDKLSVERRLGIRLSWVEYFRLRTAVNEIEVRFPRKVEGIVSEVRIEEFVAGRRRGCKRYRRIMEGKWSTSYRSNNPMNIAAGITLWGEYMEQMGRECVELQYKLWSCALLEAEFKDFLFKLVHGKLYLNNQAAHFADVESKCTFCMINERKKMRTENVMEGSMEYARRIANLDDETVGHLFWGCRWVNGVVETVIKQITGDDNIIVSKDKYFGGWAIESKMEQELSIIILHFVKYLIFVCRNRRNIVTITYIRYELSRLFISLGKREKWRAGMDRLGEIIRGVYMN